VVHQLKLLLIRCICIASSHPQRVQRYIPAPTKWKMHQPFRAAVGTFHRADPGRWRPLIVRGRDLQNRAAHVKPEESGDRGRRASESRV